MYFKYVASDGFIFDFAYTASKMRLAINDFFNECN